MIPIERRNEYRGPWVRQFSDRKTSCNWGGPGHPKRSRDSRWEGHSIRRCLMVRGTMQSSQYGIGSLVSKCSCVS